MSKARDAVGMGPLPEADRNAELQRRSIAALMAALPTDKFVFRDERVEDAGVDGSLELLVNSRFTNLRSQVQIKSTASAEENQDGSISLQVRASNLNYLIGGQSPLYVLYVAPLNELRFAWARDERRRLDRTSPQWTEQETVTIRFAQRITSETLDDIHERIRQEGQLSRRIHDMLGRASATEHVTTSINAQTLENTDPEEVYQMLLTSGITIVSAGYGTQVRHLAGLLNSAQAREPRIQVVRAYAEYALGRYQTALGYVAEASLRRAQLSAEDQQLATYIRDACEYQIGKLSVEEYSRRLDAQIDNLAGGTNASYVLSSIRYELYTERDPVRCAELLERVRSVVSEILASNDFESEFKLHARIILLQMEGGQSAHEALDEIHQLRLRQVLGRDVDLQGMLRAQRDRWDIWERAVEDALRDAMATNSPLIIADALAMRASIRMVYLLNARLFNPVLDIQIEFPEEVFQPPISDAEQAIRIYAQADQMEGELRAKITLADLLVLAGQEARAHEIAHEVLPMAQAMNYSGIEQRAQEHISGQSLLHRSVAAADEAPTRDSDFSLAEYPRELIRKTARDTLRALDLPDNRLPILEREIESYSDIARERLHWCQHIDLIQDIRHTRDQSTHYARDPERLCMCQIFGYKSAVGSTDWKALITAFKRAYCTGCPAREPKISDG